MIQPDETLQLTDQRAEYLKKGYGRSIIERAYPIWRAWDQVRQHLIGWQVRPGEEKILMEIERKNYIWKVYDAYNAMSDVRCHRLAPPGIKGLQEQLLEVAEVSHTEMMQTVCPGWPAVSVEDKVEPK